MPISFNQIPAGSKVPFVFVEIDGSAAASQVSGQPLRLLVIGQRTTAGTAPAGKPVLYSGQNADTLFGAGSQLSYMARAAWEQYQSGEVWVCPLADPAGTAAARNLVVNAVAGATAAAGTIHLLIGGRALAVAVTAANTADQVRDAIIAAINADTKMLVTAASGGAGTVTVTAKNVGTSMNGVRIVPNYFPGQAFPPQWSITENSLVAGTGAPDLSLVLWPNLDDTHYHVIAHPYRDASILSSLDTELADRWGPQRQLDAVAIGAAVDTLSNIVTLGGTSNSKHLCMVGSQGTPTPSFSLAAAVAAQVAFQAGADPARPFQTLTLKNALAPTPALALKSAERDTLLNNGIATVKPLPGQGLQIERLVTSYQLNAQGIEDAAYLDLNTLLTLALLRLEVRSLILNRYPRHKLADDGQTFGAGQAIVTPSVVKADLVALAESWRERALVENVEAFAESLIVERSATDPTRLDIQLAPDLVNGLIVAGVQIKFLL